MFTGIISEVGIIKSVTPSQGNKIFKIQAPKTVKNKKIGDSIAIDGACHTIIAIEKDIFKFESIPETLQKTTLDTKSTNSPVNLEESMKIGATLDGHIVTGHIDQTTTIEKITTNGNSKVITLKMPTELAPFVALKGSICINGVSLTISKITPETFEVSLIPHTWSNTTFHDLKEGDAVNIEIDTIMRYCARLLNFKNPL